MLGSLAHSALQLLADRIVYAGPDGTSTWFAPKGYSLLDASDDSRRLLIGLKDSTIQLSEVVTDLNTQQGTSVTTTVGNAVWMMQLGGAEPAVRLLSDTWKLAKPGYEQMLCSMALC